MIGEDSSCHTGIPSSQGHKVFDSKVPCANCEPVGVKSSGQQVHVRERTSVIIFQLSQFWTFMPMISNLLEHLKISIMPPKNDWKVVYYIKTV